MKTSNSSPGGLLSFQMFITLVSGVTKRSHILKQTLRFQLQVCLSTHSVLKYTAFLVDTKHGNVIGEACEIETVFISEKLMK